MTRQQKVREGVRVLMDGCYEARNPDYPELAAFQPMKFLNELIPYLHSQGLVVRVDKELPDNPFFGGKPSEEKTAQWYGANAYIELIKEAGCGFFEPLIKEEK